MLLLPDPEPEPEPDPEPELDPEPLPASPVPPPVGELVLELVPLPELPSPLELARPSVSPSGEDAPGADPTMPVQAVAAHTNTHMRWRSQPVFICERYHRP